MRDYYPPFPDGAFARVSAGHFHGHLQPDERARFLVAARRLAPELLVHAGRWFVAVLARPAAERLS